LNRFLISFLCAIINGHFWRLLHSHTTPHTRRRDDDDDDDRSNISICGKIKEGKKSLKENERITDKKKAKIVKRTTLQSWTLFVSVCVRGVCVCVCAIN